MILLWGIIRLSTQHNNPPLLHFSAWIKRFEMNPIKGFFIVFIPILVMCAIVRFVMAEYNPLGVIQADARPTLLTTHYLLLTNRYSLPTR